MGFERICIYGMGMRESKMPLALRTTRLWQIRDRVSHYSRSTAKIEKPCYLGLRDFHRYYILLKSDEEKRNALAIVKTVAWQLIDNLPLRPKDKFRILRHWRKSGPTRDPSTQAARHELSMISFCYYETLSPAALRI